MRCYYINLNNEIIRNNFIRANFRSNAKPTWTLTRISASDTSYVHDHDIKGRLRPAEKACFLSHRKAVEANVTDIDHVFILEDDVIFGRMTCGIIERSINFLQRLDWDILFTDVGIISIGAMAELLNLKRQLSGTPEIRILDLKKLPFFGSSAYIINRNSLIKLRNHLSSDTELNITYDLFLRKLVYESKLKAFVLFPFVTSISDHSEISSIQLDETSRTDLVWSLFRKFIWLEGNAAGHSVVIEEIRRGVDAETAAYATLWAAMADPQFKIK